MVYITTDRPVYRPGQQVRYKEVWRNRDRGKLSVPDAGTVTVEIRDPDGRLVQSKEHEWNDACTLSGSFQLAKEPSLGEYRVVVDVKTSPAGA